MQGEGRVYYKTMNQIAPPSWDEVRTAFQKIWGYADFRPPQGEIVRALLEQKDGLIIMPTGGGKSICFQLPALLQTGVTLVVSPLVALMENQVQELQALKLPAALLHSELPTYERKQTLLALEKQKLRLLYLSPETLLSKPVWERICLPHVQINGIILDEAHCLVQWGETFRPAYRRLGAVRSALLKSKPKGTKISVAAFTATAETLAQNSIQKTLCLDSPEIFCLNPLRSNLTLNVRLVWTSHNRKQQLLKFIEERQKHAGLVYVRTRRDSENLAVWFSEKGYVTAPYHAGLGAEDRRSIENDWISGKIPFVICTSAFGMGINKPDVRWVAHFHAPLFLSEYVQEVGRGGRDGKPAEALTLISEPTGWLDPEDKQRQQFFEDKITQQQLDAQRLITKLPKQGDVDSVARQFHNGTAALSLLHSAGQLTWVDPFHYIIHPKPSDQKTQPLNSAQQMNKYLSTKNCRWQFLLNAFGFEKEAANFRCGSCDNCKRVRS